MILRRLATALPTLFGVSLLVFGFLHLVPGDPVEAMLGESAAPADVALLRRDLGLDQPIGTQLVRFLARTVRGDLGESVSLRTPVVDLVRATFPATLTLALAALAVSTSLAIPLGVIAAIRSHTWVDRLIRVTSLAGIVVPTFWLGPCLVLVFGAWLRWLPISGRGSLAHVVLPTLTLAAGMTGVLVRLVRTNMLTVLQDDFVRAARARGASPLRATAGHALRVAVVPVVTVIGLQFGALLAGAVVTETIFAWPGLGRLLVQAISARDYPLVQGCVLVIGTSYVLVNFVVDAVQAWLDPRLRDA